MRCKAVVVLCIAITLLGVTVEARGRKRPVQNDEPLTRPKRQRVEPPPPDVRFFFFNLILTFIIAVMLSSCHF